MKIKVFLTVAMLMNFFYIQPAFFKQVRTLDRTFFLFKGGSAFAHNVRKPLLLQQEGETCIYCGNIVCALCAQYREKAKNDFLKEHQHRHRVEERIMQVGSVLTLGLVAGMAIFIHEIAQQDGVKSKQKENGFSLEKDGTISVVEDIADRLTTSNGIVDFGDKNK